MQIAHQSPNILPACPHRPPCLPAGMAPSDEPLPSYCLPFDAPEEQPLVKILTRRPTVPGDAEQAANVRSRSAKLRVVQKL